MRYWVTEGGLEPNAITELVGWRHNWYFVEDDWERGCPGPSLFYVTDRPCMLHKVGVEEEEICLTYLLFLLLLRRRQDGL